MVKELIRNGGFERGDLAFWEMVRGEGVISTTLPKHGSYCAKLTTGALSDFQIRHRDYIEVFQNELYKGSIWVKGLVGGNTFYLYTYFLDADLSAIGSDIITSKTIHGEWLLMDDYFVIPERCSYIRPELYANMGGVGEEIYIDSLSLQNINTAAVCGKNVLIASVSNVVSDDTFYTDSVFAGLWNSAEYTLYCTSLTSEGAPTLDVIIQGYDPEANVWKDVLVFQQLGAAGSESKTVLSGLGWKQRVKYTTGGTVTDCDFKVGVIYKR